MSQQTSGGRIAQATQQQEQNSPERALWAAEGHIGAILPSHLNAKSWIGVAIGALKRDDKLYRAAMGNPGSLMSAMLRAAQDGLKPGTEEFYLIPYGSEVQGIRGYQGELALIYRGGAVSSVVCEVVYENDTFTFSPSSGKPPVHEVNWGKDRGDMMLTYAYAHMVDGGISKVVVMDKSEVEKRRAASPSWKNDKNGTSPWNKWPKSMWLKSSVHELQKWVPTSAEFIRDRINAQAAVELEQVRAKALATAQAQLGITALPGTSTAAPAAPPAGLGGEPHPAQQAAQQETDAKASVSQQAQTQQAVEAPQEQYSGDPVDYGTGELTDAEAQAAQAKLDAEWGVPAAEQTSTTTTKGKK
jgi:recombination protein RecT